jgi:hypothetical protein
MAATSACDIAMADLKQKETAEWKKTYELAPGGRLSIANVNGKIDIEPAAGSGVEIIAQKSARAGSSDAARQALGRIEIRENVSPSDIRIETKLSGGGGLFGGGSLEVQYSVRVPAGAEVKVSTVNGGIELRGLGGRVTAEATNGGIKANGMSGEIRASTTNGGVEVDLAHVPESGVKLDCTNGGIQLQLPSDAKASISARIVNGGIDTGNLQMEATGESSRRRLDARLNGGGPRIDLEGVNGGIRIRGR